MDIRQNKGTNELDHAGSRNNVLPPKPPPISKEATQKDKAKVNNLVAPNPTTVKPKRNPLASGIRKTTLAWDHFTRLPFNRHVKRGPGSWASQAQSWVGLLFSCTLKHEPKRIGPHGCKLMRARSYPRACFFF